MRLDLPATCKMVMIPMAVYDLPHTLLFNFS
jgi:hypothetical protein